MSLRTYNPDPLEVLTAMFDAPCLLPARKVTMWTIPQMIRPALSATRHGMGDLLIALSPMQHRPCYYLVWIDAAWWPVDGYLDHERLDEIWEALEDEFGRRERDDEGNVKEPYRWPDVDDSDGCCWCRANPDHILTSAARRRLIPAWEERNAQLTRGVDVPGEGKR